MRDELSDGQKLSWHSLSTRIIHLWYETAIPWTLAEFRPRGYTWSFYIRGPQNIIKFLPGHPKCWQGLSIYPKIAPIFSRISRNYLHL